MTRSATTSFDREFDAFIARTDAFLSSADQVDATLIGGGNFRNIDHIHHPDYEAVFNPDLHDRLVKKSLASDNIPDAIRGMVNPDKNFSLLNGIMHVMTTNVPVWMRLYHTGAHPSMHMLVNRQVQQRFIDHGKQQDAHAKNAFEAQKESILYFVDEAIAVVSDSRDAVRQLEMLRESTCDMMEASCRLSEALRLSQQMAQPGQPKPLA